MSKTRILVHIVFTTKNREQTITTESKRRLYAYVHGIIERHMCKTIRINGMSDHIHILINLHPTISLSSLVKDIKTSTSVWLKDSVDFPAFRGWNVGYYAASIGPDGENSCINYIKEQELHHQSNSFLQEVKEFAMINMLEWNERDWDSSTPQELG